MNIQTHAMQRICNLFHHFNSTLFKRKAISEHNKYSRLFGLNVNIVLRTIKARFYINKEIIQRVDTHIIASLGTSCE